MRTMVMLLVQMMRSVNYLLLTHGARFAATFGCYLGWSFGFGQFNSAWDLLIKGPVSSGKFFTCRNVELYKQSLKRQPTDAGQIAAVRLGKREIFFAKK